MTTTTIFIQLVSTQCPYEDCRRIFGLLASDVEQGRRTHKFHVCPFCKRSQGWNEKSDLEKLQEEARWAKERLETERANHALAVQFQQAQKERALAERNAARSHLSRVKNRMQHGVCPHCNRTFAALARHMATKHPKEKAAK